MRIDVWSDVVCPWCYIGKRNLEAALGTIDVDQRRAIDVRWHAFELDPAAPPVKAGDYRTRLARKYGDSPGEPAVARLDVADAMIARMEAAGSTVGLTFRFDIARAGNTFDAHRLLHFARVHGMEDAMNERLFAAYFTEGIAIGERKQLVELATQVGFAADEVSAALAGDAYIDAVRGDEDLARAIGVAGVPFFLVDGTYGISGAQPPEVLRNVIRRAWNDTAAAGMATTDDGAAGECSDGSCVL